MSVQNAIKIAEKTNYLNKDIQYLKNVQISEWDIHSAGLSVLKFRKLLPPEKLEELSNMNKHNRTVAEGLIQKDNPAIAKEIVDTLSKAIQGFIVLNQIDEYQILSIKKDAVFIINGNISQSNVKQYFEFRKKNIYTSYLYTGRVEIYYNSINNEIEIKGISNEYIERANKFVEDFKELVKAAEINNSETVFNLLRSYAQRYLSRKLPIESYRELKTGQFRIGEYLLDEVGEEDKDKIDITQNYLNFILPLINQVL